MGISLQEALSLNGFNNAVIRAGHCDLERVIRWIHVSDVPEAAEWVWGGELLFITGIGIKNTTDDLVNLVRALAAKNLAGLVINTGPYLQEIPQKVLNVANELCFPVFELPWQVKLVDVTRTISSRIVAKQMEEKSLQDLIGSLINGDVGNDDFLISRAGSHGFDLNSEHQVLIVDIDHFQKYIQNSEIIDERIIQSKKAAVQNIVSSVCTTGRKKALTTVKSDNIIVLLQIESMALDDVRKLADEIRETVLVGNLGFTVSVGIGSVCHDLHAIPDSYTDAKNALAIANMAGQNNCTLSFKETGFSRLLFHIKDRGVLESYYLDTFGKLIGDENSRDNELLETLRVYIEQNCNLQKTADCLFIHKNTLKYRLKKIEATLGLTLNEGANLLNLAVGFAVGRFLDLS